MAEFGEMTKLQYALLTLKSIVVEDRSGEGLKRGATWERGVTELDPVELGRVAGREALSLFDVESAARAVDYVAIRQQPPLEGVALSGFMRGAFGLPRFYDAGFRVGGGN